MTQPATTALEARLKKLPKTMAQNVMQRTALVSKMLLVVKMSVRTMSQALGMSLESTVRAQKTRAPRTPQAWRLSRVRWVQQSRKRQGYQEQREKVQQSWTAVHPGHQGRYHGHKKRSQ